MSYFLPPLIKQEIHRFRIENRLTDYILIRERMRNGDVDIQTFHRSRTVITHLMGEFHLLNLLILTMEKTIATNHDTVERIRLEINIPKLLSVPGQSIGIGRRCVE